MLKVEVPGRKTYELRYLLLDYNGTIALDGKLLDGLAERFRQLSEQLEIYVLTADTYGTVRAQCEGLPVQVYTFPRPDAAGCKLEIAEKLGAGVVCLGNGYNDQLMCKAADLAIAVLDREGMYPGLLAEADVLVRSPLDGLDLLLHPDRLRATLRG